MPGWPVRVFNSLAGRLSAEALLIRALRWLPPVALGQDWMWRMKEDEAMTAKETRGFGLSLVAVGVAAIVFAVLLVGVTTASGAPDWVSIVTAIAGAVVLGDGLFISRRKGAGGATHHSTS